MPSIRNNCWTWLSTAVIVISAALGVATFAYAWDNDRTHAIDEFSARAASELRAVDVLLERGVTALESTRSFLEVAGPVSRADFAAFAGPQLGAHAEMQALSWVPRVPASERAAFEQSARDDGFPGFVFTELAPDGWLVRAGDRETYYPMFFAEPFARAQVRFGFDFGSNEGVLADLNHARDTGTFVATKRIPLPQETVPGFGVMGILADYGNGPAPASVEERRERLRGFVTSGFTAVELLGRSGVPEELGLYVALIDISASLEEQMLYQERELEEFTAISPDFLITLDYEIGGREWRLFIMPADGVPSIWSAWQPRTLGIGVFLLVLLGGAFVVTLVRRHDQISAAVAERTVDLRHAQDELRITLQQNQAILDVAGAGIISIDADEVVTSANPAALQILGFRDDVPFVGVKIEQLLQLKNEEDAFGRPLEIWTLQEALRQGDTVERKLAYAVQGDGTTVPIETIASPLLDEAGKVIGAVSVFRDISDRLRVDRAKDEFLAMTGHELRTPLTAIHASLGLVASGVLGDVPERMSDILQNAARNSDRLVTLVNDIISLETMSLGAVQFNFAPTNALEVIRQVKDLNSSLIQEQGASVLVQGEGFEASLDSSRVIQALTNLLQNALKFSPPDSTVTLAAYASGDQGVFEVSDEGRGIPREKLNDIFGKFEQLDSSDSRLYGGVGLGLAITKAIAERHGGRVWVDDTGDAGSTFKLAVPLAWMGSARPGLQPIAD
jgi:PAS domain S-box-containing protein